MALVLTYAFSWILSIVGENMVYFMWVLLKS